MKHPEEQNDITTENSFQLQELPVNSTLIKNASITNNDDSSRQVIQRKIDLKTKVITNDQLLAELKQKEQEGQRKRRTEVKGNIKPKRE